MTKNKIYLDDVFKFLNKIENFTVELKLTNELFGLFKRIAILESELNVS